VRQSGVRMPAGFAGLASHRATTTALVTDLPEMTKRQHRGALLDSLVAGGWIPAGEEGSEMTGAVLDEVLGLIDKILAEFPVGSILERDAEFVTCRAVLVR